MISRWFNRIEEGLVAFLLGVMTLLSFGQVVARYVFNYSVGWAFELNAFIFGALIFLGISWGVRVHAHIGVDVVIKKLNPGTARVVGIIACLLCLFYTSLVFYGAWGYVTRIYDVGIYAQDVPVPMWVPLVVLPIGYALLFFRFAQVLVGLLLGRRSQLLGDEAEDALKLFSTDDVPSHAQEQP